MLGYYGYRSVSKGRDPLILIRKDRELVAGSAEPGSKGLKGEEAKKAVETKFKRSKIKDLVMPEFSKISAEDRLDELLDEEE